MVNGPVVEFVVLSLKGVPFIVVLDNMGFLPISDCLDTIINRLVGGCGKMSFVVSIQIRSFGLNDLSLGVEWSVFSLCISICCPIISNNLFNDLINLLSVYIRHIYCHYLILPDYDECNSPD